MTPLFLYVKSFLAMEPSQKHMLALIMPSSQKLHGILCFTRNGDLLTYQQTTKGPGIFTEPWIHIRRLKLSTNPAYELAEEGPCVEKDADHLITFDHD